MLPNRRKPIAEINVVPYIDVMLVLLIIFMITVPFIQQGVEVELPSAQAEPIETREDTPALVISVDDNGRFFIRHGMNFSGPTDDVAVLQQASSSIIRDNPRIDVYLRGDQSVAYGRIMQAMVALQAAGATNIGLATKP